MSEALRIRNMLHRILVQIRDARDLSIIRFELDLIWLFLVMKLVQIRIRLTVVLIRYWIWVASSVTVCI